MPVPYTYANDAASTAVGTRLVGGASLTLANASAFGSPSPSRPARIVVRRSGVMVTTLKATGRSGNTLTIDGTMDGYADAQVDAGDDCRISWTKGDAEAPYLYVDAIADDLAAQIGSIPAGPAGPPGADGAAGPPGADGADGATGAAGPGVPAGGATNQILKKTSGADYATVWADPPTGVSYPLIDGASQSSGTADQWTFKDTLGAAASAVDKDGNEGAYEIRMLLGVGFDLLAGAKVTGGVEATWPGKIGSIRIRARVNGASGGATVAIVRTRSGSDTTVATAVIAASNTAPVVIAAGSISDLTIQVGDLWDATITSPGTGMQSVSITIAHARRNR